MSNRNNGYTRIKDRKRRTGSSTPGKEKGPNCRKTPEKVQWAKDSRMYRRQPELFNKIWLEKFLPLNKHLNQN